MDKINEMLLKIKEDRGMLQKDIAEGVGVSLRSYQRYETGERKPDSEVIIRMCKFFNVSANYLLGLSDKTFVDR